MGFLLEGGDNSLLIRLANNNFFYKKNMPSFVGNKFYLTLIGMYKLAVSKIFHQNLNLHTKWIIMRMICSVHKLTIHWLIP